MTKRTYSRRSFKHRDARQRHDRPERHAIAALAEMDPCNHEDTRINGVIATLDRIARLPRATW